MKHQSFFCLLMFLQLLNTIDYSTPESRIPTLNECNDAKKYVAFLVLVSENSYCLLMFTIINCDMIAVLHLFDIKLLLNLR